MANTKKVKSAGRYGARYGIGVRKRLLKVESKQKLKHDCPYCGFARVKREAAGIFSCRKCGRRFTGGAYLPVTMAGAIVNKMVAQKSFLPFIKELTDARIAQAEAKKTAEHSQVEERGAEGEASEGGKPENEEKAKAKEKKKRKKEEAK